MTGALNEYGHLHRVLMKRPADAFVSQASLAEQWQALNYIAEPDFCRAVGEYEAFQAIVAASGAEILLLPRTNGVTADSIYTRDASALVKSGVVLGSMGKAQREPEPAAQREALSGRGLPVAGRLLPPGRLEGGDLIWLDPGTVAIGLGKRTNAEGIRQFSELIGPDVTVLTVPLPDWPSTNDVLHLMSLISPIDDRLAVVYAPLLPADFRRLLLDRGYELVEVPNHEFETMGTNVLALAPRECVILRGNPVTRTALERAQAVVHEYEGVEISLKGGGGPTCLTRPLSRIG